MSVCSNGTALPRFGRRKRYGPSLDHWTRSTGDVNHLYPLNMAARNLWALLWAFTTSRIYIGRCDICFGRPPTSLIALVAQTAANIKSDLKLAIKTQWQHLQAAKTTNGLDKFRILWTKHYDTSFVRITDNPHDSEASLEITL